MYTVVIADLIKETGVASERSERPARFARRFILPARRFCILISGYYSKRRKQSLHQAVVRIAYKIVSLFCVALAV